MYSIKRRKISVFREGDRLRERGFALIASLMAVSMLMALGILVFTVTTQDVRISSRTVGERKAFSAAESGISILIQNFNTGNLGASAVSATVVDASAVDPDSKYAISTPTAPTNGPAALPSTGFGMGTGETWGQTVNIGKVTGTNSRYNSNVSIQVGIGYGPVDITTIYR